MRKRQEITWYQSGFSLVEMLVALAISSVLSIVAINIMLYNEKSILRIQERSELMQSALVTSEVLRQAVWKSGHRSASHTPSQSLAISGVAPASQLHTGYVLDSSGMFTDRNCAGNSRSRGTAIIETTDQWYIRDKDNLSLYCKPGRGAGAELEIRLNGADFLFLYSDTRHFAIDSGRFQIGTGKHDSLYTKAVIAELAFMTSTKFSTLKTEVSPFAWRSFAPASADSSFGWRLFFPVALDIL